MLSAIFQHDAELLSEVDQEFNRVRDIFIERMQCRKGCSSCCSQLFSIKCRGGRLHLEGGQTA